MWTLIDTKLNLVELRLNSVLSIPAVKDTMGSVYNNLYFLFKKLNFSFSLVVPQAV